MARRGQEWGGQPSRHESVNAQFPYARPWNCKTSITFTPIWKPGAPKRTGPVLSNNRPALQSSTPTMASRPLNGVGQHVRKLAAMQSARRAGGPQATFVCKTCGRMARRFSRFHGSDYSPSSKASTAATPATSRLSSILLSPAEPITSSTPRSASCLR